MTERRMFAIKKPDGNYWANWRCKWIWAAPGHAKNAVITGEWAENRNFSDLEAKGFKCVEMEYKEKE